MSSLDSLVSSALADFSAANDPAALENAKARYLGKAGLLTAQLKALGALAPDARREAGARINDAKSRLESALDARREALADAKLASQLAAEAIDVSLPGRGAGAGGLHPLTLTLERIESLFASLGFTVADGPEIEDDFHNFTALNTPENHPARSMHDTFYVDGGLLLRTHTSPIQVRWMENHPPPIKIIAPGRVYRVDSDATHSDSPQWLAALLTKTCCSTGSSASASQPTLAHAIAPSCQTPPTSASSPMQRRHRSSWAMTDRPRASSSMRAASP